MKKLLTIITALLLTLTLVACNKADKGDFEDAIDRLELSVKNPDDVKSSFELVTELAHGAKATWTSNNSKVAEVKDRKGTVYAIIEQPLASQGEQTVVLTATITLGKLSENKEFKIKVPSLPENLVVVESIAKLRALAIGGKDQPTTLPVKMENVTVVGLDQDAYYVTDGTDVSLVFTTPVGLEVGDKGTLIGDAAVYFDAYQVSNAGFVVKDVDQAVTAKEVTLRDYNLLNVSNSTDAGKAAIKKAKSSTELLQLVKFTARVVIRPDFTGGSNYVTTLVGADENGKYDADNNLVLSYYKQDNHAKLDQYNGQVVTITATVRELRDARALTAGVTKPVFSLSVQKIEAPQTLDDAGKFLADYGFTVATLNYPKNGTATLPKEGSVHKTPITWELVNAADSKYIDLATSAVTVESGVRAAVKLKGTMTLGANTITKEFTIYVGDYQTKTIAEFNQLADGQTVRIKNAIVTSASSGKDLRIFLQDATGAVYGYNQDNNKFGKLLVPGAEVEIIATKGTNNGVHQVNLVEVKKTGENKTVTPEQLTSLEGLGEKQNKVLSVTGSITKKTVDNRTNYYVSVGSSELQIRTYGSNSKDIEATLQEALDGNKQATIVGSIPVASGVFYLYLFNTKQVTVAK